MGLHRQYCIDRDFSEAGRVAARHRIQNPLKAIENEPVTPAFGTLLRRYRLCVGLSQETLAERADLSVEAISALERGTRRTPYPNTIDLLSAALQLDRNQQAELAASVVRRRAPRQPRRLALTSLPSSLTSLVGRDEELSALQSLMAGQAVRLLTITGTGGVGKTRFALELARKISAEFEDGATFVTLAAVRDPSHVALALGQCLKRRDSDDSVSFDALCERIGDRHVLLVVDNFEHVLAGAPLVAEFLQRCPHAVVLVTSRETLRIAGEHEYVLPPLDSADSIALFIERARAFRPNLDVATDKDQFVAICHCLDGLPLAIELAAARLRYYPANVLLERLSSRLDTLVSGPRDAPARQKTMRDAIAWSYQLLSASEQAAFQMSSLFAGGGPPDAFGALAKTIDSIHDVGEQLASLVDKHLLIAHETDRSEIRFEMLETIREYAYEQLLLSGRFEDLQRAFATYYAGLAGRIAPHLRGPQAFDWSDAIAREYENVRATLRWALTADRSLAFALTNDLHYFWSRLGYFKEAHEWLQALGDPRDLADGRIDPKAVWEVLNLRALSYHWIDDHERACQLFRDVVAEARSLRDETLIARSLNNLGSSLRGNCDFEQSRAIHEETLKLKMQQGDQWSIATTLSNLGLALRSCRKYQEALDRHRQALDLFRSTEDRWGELAALNDIADVHRDQREYASAARFYKASLDANATFRTLAADSFEGLAAVVAGRERFRQAAVLGGAADTIRRETGQLSPPPDRPPFDEACALARKALGVDDFVLAWDEGASLSLAEALEIGRAIAGEIDTQAADT